MRTYLVEASPRNPATGAVVPTRLAGGGSKPYLWLGQNDWRSGVMDMPRFTAELEFGDAGWTGGAIPQTAALNFSSADFVLVSDLAELYWKDAPLTVRVGDDAPDSPTFPVLLTGTVAALDVADGVLTLTIGDLGTALNKPLLSTFFLGTGGTEGAASAKGRLKRRILGYAFNVEGRILDPANLIYEFADPARPLNQILRVRDRGREGAITIVTWQGSAAATLTALIASVPAQGGGVVAPSIACVKWWTTASGPLTADIRGEVGAGYVETAPEIAQGLASLGGLTINNLAAAKTARPYVAGILCDDESETISGAIDRALVGCSLSWALEPAGGIRLELWSLDASLSSVEDITSKSVARREIFAPVKGRRLGYQRNNRVMNDGEVSAAILATEMFYPDGTPVADLQPAQAGADVTGEHTSLDTANVSGVPSAELVGRLVDIEFLTGPSGAIQGAIDDIAGDLSHVRDDLTDVQTTTINITSQLDGTTDSYFKQQIIVGTGERAALSELITALGVRVGDAEASITANYTTLTDGQSALSQVVYNLNASFEGYAAINDQRYSAGVDATQAVAESVNTLSATVTDVSGDLGTLSATVTEQAGVLATVDGRTTAFWQVEANVTGQGASAFITARAEGNNGNVTSSVAIGANTFMIANISLGQWVKALDVSGGNVRIYGNLEVDGSVTTRNIQLNNITQKVRWSAAYNGTSSSTLIPSGSAFGTFGASGNPAQVSVYFPKDGGEIALTWSVNVQRTGDDNDRVSYRLRRTAPGGAVTYVGEVLKAGMGNYPVTVNWPWEDTGLVQGQYTYAIEARIDAGGGSYFNAKLLADAGFR